MTLITFCTPILSLLLTWMEKYNTTWKDLSAPLLNVLKTKYKLHFITLNHTPYYTLHCKLWIFVQVNNKLNGRVQNRSYSLGCNFPNFKFHLSKSSQLLWHRVTNPSDWFLLVFLNPKNIKIKETKSVLG